MFMLRGRDTLYTEIEEFGVWDAYGNAFHSVA